MFFSTFASLLLQIVHEQRIEVNRRKVQLRECTAGYHAGDALTSIREQNVRAVCAQAMCLEEMFQTSIPEGALFFISSHRRIPVSLNAGLRDRTKEMIRQLWEIRNQLKVPPAQYSAKCRRCSLRELCMPKTKTTARRYLDKLSKEALGPIEEQEE